MRMKSSGIYLYLPKLSTLKSHGFPMQKGERARGCKESLAFFMFLSGAGITFLGGCFSFLFHLKVTHKIYLLRVITIFFPSIVYVIFSVEESISIISRMFCSLLRKLP